MRQPVKKSLTSLQEKIEIQGAGNRLLNEVMRVRSSLADGFELQAVRVVMEKISDFLPVGHEDTCLKMKTWKKDEKPVVLQEMWRLFRDNLDYFKAIILHGSLATGEVVPGWSDVDLWVVLRDEVLREPGKFSAARQTIREAEKLMWQFDKWQHHGLQCLTERDLKFYPEVWLPLAVIKQGKIIGHEDTLVFSLRDSSLEKWQRFGDLQRLFEEARDIGELRHHGREGVYLQEDFRNAANTFYQFKYFVSLILIIPSLYLELKGRPVYKRESFDIFYKELAGEVDTEIIERAEKVRAYFGEEVGVESKIGEPVQEIFGKGYFKRAAKLMAELYPRIE